MKLYLCNFNVINSFQIIPRHHSEGINPVLSTMLKKSTIILI